VTLRRYGCPDAAQEALRDLVRACEAAKRDQHRARQRLGKFLLRHGVRRPDTMKTAWSKPHLEWIKMKVHFDLVALEVTITDYVHEVEHLAQRLTRLEAAISEAARSAPARMRAVIQALHGSAGVAEMGAVTIVTEVGELSRFTGTGQLMAYSGLVPSEHSSGSRRIQSASPRRTRLMCDGSWSKRPGPISSDLGWDVTFSNDRPTFPRK
jgi:transposase